MVEEFIDGPEYSTEILVNSGRIVFINITAKTLGALPYFAEMGHGVPASLSRLDQHLLTSSSARLVTALQVRDGLLHSEWRISTGVAYPIETAARFPGDRIPRLIESAYGVNLAEGWLRCLSRSGLALAPCEPHRYATIQFFDVEPGTVQKIHGLKEFSERIKILEMSVPKVGDVISPIRDSHSRPGFIVFESENQRSLTNAIRAFHRTTRIETSA
jgi:hypothetical protein